jgi:FkbM family methyltransferase
MKAPSANWGAHQPRQPLARLMLLVVQSGLSRGGVRKAITRSWLKRYGAGPVDITYHGLRFRAVPDGNVTDQKLLLRSGRRDTREFELIQQFDPAKTAFADIGANIGYYSLFAARMGYGRVIAFEPNPVIFERLAFNVRANNLGDRILVEACALSDQEGKLYLNASGDAGSGFLSLEPVDEQAAEVPVRPLADVLRDRGIDELSGLKIDVEGHEDRVLVPYLRDLPTEKLPRVAVIEHVHQKYWREDLLGCLDHRGYRVQLETRSNLVFTR